MNQLRDAGCWITDNWADLGNLLFAAVVAWTAWVGVRLNRRLAESELDPAITVYLELDRGNNWFFDLVVKNMGRGAARNIRFRVDPDIPVQTDDEDSRLTQLGVFSQGIDYMAPLQEIRTFYGSFMSITKKPITIHTTYDRETPNPVRRLVSASFVIDVRPYEGTSHVGEPNEQVIAKSLKSLADDISKIRQGGSRWSPQVTVVRRYVFSATVTRIWRRWFGDRRFLGRDESAWKHFRGELRKILAGRRGGN